MQVTDRRRILALTAGVGVAASAGLLLTGCGKKDDEGGEEVTANEDLMREHGVLRRILVLYREIAPRIAADPAHVDAAALGRAAALFRRFGEHYHEQLLEEQHIFPRIRGAGPDRARLVDTLTAQHARGRQITEFVIDRTRAGAIGSGDAAPLSSALLAFARMYEAHAAREDTIVFPAFKAALGAHDYAELGEQFEEIEHREFGGDGFDIALAEVTRIEAALGLPDLAAFTAPPPGGA
jgi:hemerythrin-like domain-containing protein